MTRKIAKQVTRKVLANRRFLVWGKAVELVRLVRRSPIEDAELRRHAQQAATSVALNIAEGAAHGGGARGRHFKIARGSVGEVAAAYELADAIGESVPVAEVIDQANQLAAMLSALIRR